jgi:hypothetical protein
MHVYYTADYWKFPGREKEDNVKLGIFKTDSHGVNKGH